MSDIADIGGAYGRERDGHIQQLMDCGVRITELTARVAELEAENERLAREYNQLGEVYVQCLAERLEYKGEAERVAELEEQLAKAQLPVEAWEIPGDLIDRVDSFISGLNTKVDAIHADVRRLVDVVPPNFGAASSKLGGSGAGAPDACETCETCESADTPDAAATTGEAAA
ncbi:hypothetical protein GCM10010124_25980 [Pilimelia terevasa]|uniref:Uncharacterized protein n=1 Tax=Pilimelia terevasa TaxID=53372 RepID=A0A8J3BNJ1_9ACTN|nr:hypothetical protein [Pilimelia terevasa]GGK32020.1 hypothetical protein GCM10010124_25980 [Pilimelia terevasa]